MARNFSRIFTENKPVRWLRKNIIPDVNWLNAAFLLEYHQHFANLLLHYIDHVPFVYIYTALH